eukprot:scaffold9276_cov112-Isochrysis_galbana.AAC.8
MPATKEPSAGHSRPRDTSGPNSCASWTPTATARATASSSATRAANGPLAPTRPHWSASRRADFPSRKTRPVSPLPA